MASDAAPPTVDSLLAETEWVRALAHRLVVDPGTADDVAQDAAVIALTKAPRDAGAVRGWFRRVVANLASNARRGEARRGVRERSTAAGEATEAADEVVARWEVRRKVVEAVLALDEPYRSTVLLRFFEGLTAAEAASRLGVPFETVRTRTRRGLDLLRGRLAHLDDGRGRRGAAALFLIARPDADLVGGAATGAASTALVGGLAMGTATKWAAVLAVGALVAAWSIATVTSPARNPSNAVASGTAASASKAGRSPRRGAAAEKTVPAAADGIDLDACDRECDLFGTVLDPDGHLVAGARVTVLRQAKLGAAVRTPTVLWDRYLASETTTSASDGTFVLHLRPGDGVGLRVDAAPFALWESDRRQAGEFVTVRLRRALTLDLRVTTSDGLPAAAVPIRVLAARTDAGESAFIARRADTDAAGLARFDRLPRATSVLVVAVPDRLPGADRTVELLDAESQTVEIALAAGKAVHGIVVDAASKVGIAGARVRRGNAAGTAAVTDSLGRFDVAADPLGTLVAAADGYANASAKVPESGDLTLALGPAVRVTGRTVDEARRPLAGVDVTLFTDARTHRGGELSAGAGESAADGTFTVEGCVAGEGHVLRVRAEGRAQLVRAVTTPSAAPYLLELGDVVVGPGRLLRGRVVNGAGNPMAHTEVRLTCTSDVLGSPLSERRTTDDRGRFAFLDLPPGSFEIEGPRTNVRNWIDAKVEADRDPGPVTLRIDDGARDEKSIPVKARVTDEDGNPVADVKLSFGYVANGAARSGTTDASGTMSGTAAFQPENVIVWLSPEQARVYVPPRVLLSPGQTEAAIALRRGKLVAGRVLGEDGRPVWEGSVSAYDGARQVAWGTTNREGRFAFAVPPGRRVDLQATPRRDGREITRAAGVAPDVEPGMDDVEIRIVAEPVSRSVDVEVVDGEGAPVAGAQVNTEFTGLDWSLPVMGWTAEEGRVRLEGLPRGPVSISATIHDRARGANRHWTPLPVRVAGDADRVRIVVGKTRTVRGRVVLEDGAPLAGAYVSASAGGLYGSMNVAGSDGRFELLVPADAPVPFAVTANPMPPDMKKPLAGWDLVEAEDRELAIVVRPVPGR